MASTNELHTSMVFAAIILLVWQPSEYCESRTDARECIQKAEVQSLKKALGARHNRVEIRKESKSVKPCHNDMNQTQLILGLASFPNSRTKKRAKKP